MKCWYLIDTICDRPPGICEGCEKYEDWRKESERVTDFATRTFKCSECGNTKFYCYPQTVVVGKEKHDWEYTCTKCKCVTVLRTVDWRVKK